MRLQELKTKEAIGSDEVAGRRVRVFLHPAFFELSGVWQWELEAEAVFCSDVMLSAPAGFVGTRGIFHPDDVAALKEKLAGKQPVPFLQFRIITTYGEVKTLTGENISVHPNDDNTAQWQQEAMEAVFQQ